MENKENLKTLEELSALKEETKGVNKKKLKYLTEEELALVTGGEGTGRDGCTGGTPNKKKCNPCSYFTGITCTLSGKGLAR